ncbi:hypothetical protein ACFWP3_20815 [Streptomyces sp. NPDC058525]
MTAPPGIPSHDGLRFLASWAATPAGPRSGPQGAEAEAIKDPE